MDASDWLAAVVPSRWRRSLRSSPKFPIVNPCLDSTLGCGGEEAPGRGARKAGGAATMDGKQAEAAGWESYRAWAGG